MWRFVIKNENKQFYFKGEKEKPLLTKSSLNINGCLQNMNYYLIDALKGFKFQEKVKWMV